MHNGRIAIIKPYLKMMVVFMLIKANFFRPFISSGKAQIKLFSLLSLIVKPKLRKFKQKELGCNKFPNSIYDL